MQMENVMKTMNATDAKNRFGELLDSAQAGPVAIQKNGRDVAYLVSKDDFEKFTGGDGDKVNPLVKTSLERSLKKWPKVYEALAK